MRFTLCRASVLLSFALLGTALLAPVAQAKLGDRAPLRSGMRGQDVRVLQDYLTKAGHDTDVDGAFGRGTRSSVRAFERAASLTRNERERALLLDRAAACGPELRA